MRRATLGGTYTPLMLEMMDALNLDRVDVYGTHTGAGLAVELAIAAPERVRSLVLEGVPLFDDDPTLVASVLEEYFVDLAPDRHGSHLVRAWNMVRDSALWWPWFRQRPDSERTTELLKEEVVQDRTEDLLGSLPYYWVAYRAAWTWRSTERLPLVRQDALVGSTPTDSLNRTTSRTLALMPTARGVSFASPLAEPRAELIRRFLG
jgi:pimeloyl-ACP methyl ester carboxylesterase